MRHTDNYSCGNQSVVINSWDLPYGIWLWRVISSYSIPVYILSIAANLKLLSKDLKSNPPLEPLATYVIRSSVAIVRVSGSSGGLDFRSLDRSFKLAAIDSTYTCNVLYSIMIIILMGTCIRSISTCIILYQYMYNHAIMHVYM